MQGTAEERTDSYTKVRRESTGGCDKAKRQKYRRRVASSACEQADAIGISGSIAQLVRASAS